MDSQPWVWNFDVDYPGQIGQNDSLLPIHTIWKKIKDGISFQSRYSSHNLEASDIGGVVKLEKSIYGAQKIEMIPWGVENGAGGHSSRYASRAVQEGTMAGLIAKAAAGPGDLVAYGLDLEPYTHDVNQRNYWLKNQGAGFDETQAWMEAYAQAGGQAVYLIVDARNNFLDLIDLDGWLVGAETFGVDIAGIYPMIYTDQFHPTKAHKINSRNDINRGLNVLQEANVNAGMVYPILGGGLSPDVLEDQIKYCYAQGCGGFGGLWRRGIISPSVMLMMAALESPWGTEPEEPEEPKEPEIETPDRISLAVSYRQGYRAGFQLGSAMAISKVQDIEAPDYPVGFPQSTPYDLD